MTVNDDFFVIYLNEGEYNNGYLNIPPSKLKLIESRGNKIKCEIEESTIQDFSYNKKYKRLYLKKEYFVSWFPNTIPKYRRLVKVTLKKKIVQISPIKEGKEIYDKIKGRIGENVIQNLILTRGEGYLNLYEPIEDIEGYDLIVNFKNNAKPIFLQIKCRVNLDKNSNEIREVMNISVKKSTFKASDNFFIVALYYQLEKLKPYKDIYLIPSKNFLKKQTKKLSGDSYRASIPIFKANKWDKYIVDYDEFASILINKFLRLGLY